MKKILNLVIVSVVFFLSSFFKVSFGVGSFKFFFTGLNFLAPAVGFLMQSTLGLFILPFLWIFKFSHCVTFGLPTLIAGFCWFVFEKKVRPESFNFVQDRLLPRFVLSVVDMSCEALAKREGYGPRIIALADFILRFLLPLTAILIFVLNPASSDAFLYSFYWFIPVLIYLVQRFGKLSCNNNNCSLFCFSLSVSFVSHAVGSIIWLYMIPMTSAQWILLIPVVFFERLVFAAGSMLIYLGLKKLNFNFNLFVFKEKKFCSFLSSRS